MTLFVSTSCSIPEGEVVVGTFTSSAWNGSAIEWSVLVTSGNDASFTSVSLSSYCFMTAIVTRVSEYYPLYLSSLH